MPSASFHNRRDIVRPNRASHFQVASPELPCYPCSCLDGPEVWPFVGMSIRRLPV